MNDTKRIKAAMVMQGYTIRTLASEIGISQTAMFNKIHNKSEFTSSEIAAISNLLEIEDKDKYFFVPNVN